MERTTWVDGGRALTVGVVTAALILAAAFFAPPLAGKVRHHARSAPGARIDQRQLPVDVGDQRRHAFRRADRGAQPGDRRHAGVVAQQAHGATGQIEYDARCQRQSGRRSGFSVVSSSGQAGVIVWGVAILGLDVGKQSLVR